MMLSSVFCGIEASPADIQPSQPTELLSLNSESLPSHEAKLEALDERSFDALARHETLRGVALLLRCGIDVFSSFQCNVSAALVLREKLSLASWIFGDSWYGLIARAEARHIQFPKKKISALEDLLSEALKYFSRFTKADFLNYCLLGKEPEERFRSFDKNLTESINAISKEMELWNEDVNMPDSPEYLVYCDALPAIRRLDKEQQRSGGANPHTVSPWNKYVATLAATRGQQVTPQLEADFLAEIEEMKSAVLRLNAVGSAAVVHEPRDIISQMRLRQLWAENFPQKLEVPTGDLLNALEVAICADYDFDENVDPAPIQQQEDGDQAPSAEPERMLKRDLSKLLADFSGTAQRTSATEILKSPSSPRVDGEKVDCYQLARISKCVEKDETDLLAILQKIVLCWGSAGTFLIPGLESSRCQVYYDEGQRETLQKLLNQKGTFVVSGPLHSGKSTRLLHTIHMTHKPKRDVVWIDFSNVYTDVDAVGRVSSQLFFRKCHVLSDLDILMRQLFDALRMDSVVVLDNIRLKNPYAISDQQAVVNVGMNNYGPPMLSANSAGTDADNSFHWIEFVTHLLQLCLQYTSKFCVLVVSENADALQRATGLQFDNELFIGPLQQEALQEMVTTLQPDVKRSSFIPVDPAALRTSSFGFAGLVSTLAYATNMRTLRAIAAQVSVSITNLGGTTPVSTPIDISSVQLRSEIGGLLFGSLSEDEKLLACCLVSYIGFFDVPLVWSLSKELFNDDLVRFILAWTGLVEVRWVIYRSDLGYELNYFAVAIYPTVETVNQRDGKRTQLTNSQSLFDKCILHFCDELVAMNRRSRESSFVLEYFNARLPHFKRIFEVILHHFHRYHGKPPIGAAVLNSDEESKQISSTLLAGSPDYFFSTQTFALDFVMHRLADRSVLHSVIRKITGNTSRVMSYHLSPVAAVVVSRACKSELSESDGVLYELASLELAEQYFRNSNFADGLVEIKSIVTNFYNIKKPVGGCMTGPPFHAIRALVIYAKLLFATKQYSNAATVSAAALGFDKQAIEDAAFGSSSEESRPIPATAQEKTVLERIRTESEQKFRISLGKSSSEKGKKRWGFGLLCFGKKQ